MNKYFGSNFSSMNRSLFIGVFAVAFAALLSAQPVSFAEETRPLCASCVRIQSYDLEMYKTMFPLIIWTDTPTYDHNSTITLNGYIKPQNIVAPVTITIRNPIGNVVHIEQITPNGDGTFEITLDTSSQLWKQDGEYAIFAQGGTVERSFKTSVDLVPYDVVNSNAIPEFGSLAALILIVSIGSIIVLSRKSFASFVTKI